MIVEIVRLYSIDLKENLENFLPTIEDNFGFRLCMIVGEIQIGGEESFEMMVCTPKWLIDNHNHEEIIIGRHYLLVFEYSYNKILDKLKQYLSNLRGDSWQEITEKIGRVGHWEFEDYQE